MPESTPVLASAASRVDRDMPDTAKPVVNRKRSALYVQLRMYYRLVRLGLHVVEGFVLAFACGALFFQYRHYQRPVISWWHRRLCNILGLQIRVHGAPLDGTALWISNHVSWMDIPVLGGLFPVYFLSKAEVARWPLIGTLAKAAGTLFIQRGSGDSGNIARQLGGHLQAGRNVIFFPEGTTTNGHTVKRFFSKLFAANLEGHCPIQPVLVCYRDDDGLHPYAPFIDDDEFFAHTLDMLKAEPMVVEVKILPPENVDGRNSKALAHHFEELMRHELQLLHGVAEAPVRG
jgi:1-acyl-sn-glycerol-3-phosphate acyltransferase